MRERDAGRYMYVSRVVLEDSVSFTYPTPPPLPPPPHNSLRVCRVLERMETNQTSTLARKVICVCEGVQCVCVCVCVCV